VEDLHNQTGKSSRKVRRVMRWQKRVMRWQKRVMRWQKRVMRWQFFLQEIVLVELSDSALNLPDSPRLTLREGEAERCIGCVPGGTPVHRLIGPMPKIALRVLSNFRAAHQKPPSRAIQRSKSRGGPPLPERRPRQGDFRPVSKPVPVGRSRTCHCRTGVGSKGRSLRF